MTTESPRITASEALAARKEAGLTQQQSADLLGVHLRTWQKWEYGKREMSPAYLEMFLILSKEPTP
ncbi:helix-turn-helix domain-containing protein [Acetobacter senegalensis]|uniref:helix-turn-helix domain-containing protein n=1 Tax=Acetobacter senegalensis TaxID=446692 RepID=UPI002653D157|nr:helix-turn-helix domain-containing protein [Acetobacter senegalensis]MDN7351553.1 helix-turn-helix domain-containing protein [Acetobacter senegalensis]